MSDFFKVKIPWTIYAGLLEKKYPKEKADCEESDQQRKDMGVNQKKGNKRIKIMDQPVKLELSELFDFDKIKDE